MYPYGSAQPGTFSAMAPSPQSPHAPYPGTSVPVAQFQQLSINTSPHPAPHSVPSDGNVVCGPLLRYIETDYRTRTYRGSVLIVSDHRQPPSLQVVLRTPSGKSHTVIPPPAECLDTFRNQYNFWRYELRLPLVEEQQTATYSSPCLGRSYTFYVPAIYQSMRFMFHSCNGFSDIPQETKDKFGEKEAPLWQDVLDRHEVMPFHVLLGGGDQLYQDRLIHEDFMKPWNDEKDPKKRVAMTLPKEMKDGLEHFYFYNYVKNFG